MGNLSLSDPVNGTVADAGLIATNNAAIKTVINGGLDNSNITSGANITPSKLAGYPGDGTKALFGDGTWAVPSGGGGTTIPVGAVSMYAGTSAPSGWLLLDGTTFSTSTHSALFSLLGSGTLPDMRGRVPAGYAASGGHTDVSTLLNNDGVTVSHRRPKHRHTVSGTFAATNLGSSGGADALGDAATGGNRSDYAASTSVKVGNDTTNDPLDAPAYLVLNFIIKT